MRRLFPDPGTTTVPNQIHELDLISSPPAERPYLITNFAVTVDGKATLHGRSGSIGSDTDTEMLVCLRTRVDAVMIGAGTMRAERYGRPVADPGKRGRRERRGLSQDPLLVIVSGRLNIPWDAPVFADRGARVLIFTTSQTEAPETVAEVRIVRHEGTVDLAAALGYLRSERGVRALLCEGGPRLHGQLLDAGLVDELFITHAPKLAGGEGPGLEVGLAELERPLEVAWLLHEDGELFARYRVIRA
ncbi:MAG TPA: dihydrofolate reductase family protein [Solirubrobacterales bacterium]|jgi:riboflavin-specific deaminase-like protein|nr:dihydrofolate reductase family protein [Solirubrobacterales bacterium]